MMIGAAPFTVLPDALIFVKVIERRRIGINVIESPDLTRDIRRSRLILLFFHREYRQGAGSRVKMDLRRPPATGSCAHAWDCSMHGALIAAYNARLAPAAIPDRGGQEWL